MSPVDVTRPWFLLTLLALVPVALLARFTLTRLGRPRFWVSTAARVAAVACLALALSGLRRVKVSDELAVVFILDRSRSVPAEDEAAALDRIREISKAAGPRESVGLVVFGKEASVETSPSQGFEIDKIRSVVTPEGTDIARALRLAAAACPEGAQKRLVLFSDGNENLGDAAREAIAAKARGAEVWVASLGKESSAEVRIDRVVAPTRVAPREPYEVTAIVTSTADLEVTFRVIKNRTPLDPVRRAIRKGTWPVTFVMKARDDEAGSALDFEVYVQAPDGTDTWRENNVGRAHARVEGASRVLYVDGKPGETEELTGCLRDAGIDVELRGVAGFPISLAEMDAFDAILVCDLPSRALSKPQQEALRQYVHDLGGGLAMIGGDSSFGAGAWQRTPVEEALPVLMDVRNVKHLASLGICIVVDSSGSMSARARDGRTKLELAGEAASEVVRILGPRDEISIATVDTTTHWVVKTRQVADNNALQKEVQNLRPGGGGIYCNVALEAAFKEIRNTSTQMRHVILFSDSADSEQKEGCEALVDAATQDGITLSVVAIGRETDRDAAWLREIAERGGGRYSITDDALDLPRIFAEEVVAASRSVLVEEEFQPVFAKPAQFLEGAEWATAPSLLGYVATVPKPTAEVHLEAKGGDPLLAKWRHGLGKSAAFTSDAKGRWAKNWIQWPGYRALWPQLVRWLLRRADASAFTVATTLAGPRAHLTVDAVASSGRFRDFLKLRAFVAGPGGSSVETVLRQTGPGRYEADIDAGDAGSWFVTVAEEDAGGWAARASVPILVAYPAEFRVTAPNGTLLKRIAEITGGRILDATSLEGLFRHTSAPARRFTELWRELLSIALAALFLDILARRFGLPSRRRAPIAASPAAEPGYVGRLRDAKAGAVRVGGDSPALPGFAAPRAPLTSDPSPRRPADRPAAPGTPTGGYLERLREAKKRAHGTE